MTNPGLRVIGPEGVDPWEKAVRAATEFLQGRWFDTAGWYYLPFSGLIKERPGEARWISKSELWDYLVSRLLLRVRDATGNILSPRDRRAIVRGGEYARAVFDELVEAGIAQQDRPNERWRLR